MLNSGTLNPPERHKAVFKKQVPRAIALIRTGDTTQYSNMILVSA